MKKNENFKQSKTKLINPELALEEKELELEEKELLDFIRLNNCRIPIGFT